MVEVSKTVRHLRFRIHVTPGARRASIGGVYDGALRISVAAPAENGKANRAVIKSLADSLGVKRSQVEVVVGDASRRKLVEVCCEDVSRVERRLEDLAAVS